MSAAIKQMDDEVPSVSSPSPDIMSLGLAAAETRSTISTPGRQRTKKRRAYVRNACISCKARKVRCTGEHNCAQCRALGAECVYQVPEKKRQTNGRTTPGDVESLEAAGLVDAGQQREWALIMQRVQDLEANYSALQRQLDAASLSPTACSKSDDASPGTDSTLSTLPDKDEFRGSTSFVTQMAALKHSIACQSQAQADSGEESRAASPWSETWSHMPRSAERSLPSVEKEMRQVDLLDMRRSVDTYFLHLNPLFPCLNENTFRQMFDNFLAGEGIHELTYADRNQFIALLNLISAEVHMLNDESPSDGSAPAWEMFCRAENILNPLTWLGNGNILTIQCLLAKARYLLYAEKPYAAYDTMGRVVRLCWQLGLQQQPSWTGLEEFEVVLRQRVFWTALYMDRHIALIAGAPYLIRKSEVNVQLPPNMEDTLFLPGQPLPPLAPGRNSLHPHLLAATEWASLSSEVWDAVCGANAQTPTNPEVIASMDARIQFKQSQVQTTLQWSHWTLHEDGVDGPSQHTVRQSTIFNQACAYWLDPPLQLLTMISANEPIAPATPPGKDAESEF